MGIGLSIDFGRGGLLLLAGLVVLLCRSGLGGCRRLFLLTIFGCAGIILCLLFWWCDGGRFLNCNFNLLSPLLNQIGVPKLGNLVDVVLNLELEFNFATALNG